VTSKKTGLLSGKVGRMSGKERVLNYLYENPGEKFTVRSLAKDTKITRSTLQTHLQLLQNGGIVSGGKWNDTWENRWKKTMYFIEKINSSGLVGYLEKELGASAVVLFGSFSKGESNKSSDIDLFVQSARDKKVNLSGFEKTLGREIQLFTEVKISKLPKHLLNNVLNGIKLKGYFTI
jgi:predicted nucleotidyltransferase